MVGGIEIRFLSTADIIGGIKIGCLSKADIMGGINIGCSSRRLPFCNAFDTV